MYRVMNYGSRGNEILGTAQGVDIPDALPAFMPFEGDIPNIPAFFDSYDEALAAVGEFFLKWGRHGISAVALADFAKNIRIEHTLDYWEEVPLFGDEP